MNVYKTSLAIQIFCLLFAIGMGECLARYICPTFITLHENESLNHPLWLTGLAWGCYLLTYGRVGGYALGAVGLGLVARRPQSADWVWATAFSWVLANLVFWISIVAAMASILLPNFVGVRLH